MIQLTDEQKQVHAAAIEFARRLEPGHLTIGGLAGTGKTTLTGEIVRTLREINPQAQFAFVCYTGKAASVLRTKLEASHSLVDEEYCGTIHGLIYEPIVVQQRIIGWKRVEEIKADLIFVDEASMVNETIWDDLRSYDVPIIAIGDHGQLPPIEGSFNLMSKPKHKLTKIHRQAEGNPIIKLSMLAREEGKIPCGEFGSRVRKVNSSTNESVLDMAGNIRETLFLSGTNRTRKSVNAAVRARLGFNNKNPMAGEKVICLKNNREAQIFNGVCGVLKLFRPESALWARVEVDMETGVCFEGDVVRPQFGSERTLQECEGINPKNLRELFDWGYCLTVHKAQGSEAESVVLFEERFSFFDEEQWRRWLYTAVTRARENLLIVNRTFSKAN